MSFIFTLESFKFYKIKHENVLRALFLVAFLLNAMITVFPPGDTNFGLVFEKIQAGVEAANPVTIMEGFNLLNKGHYLYFGSQILLALANLFISYTYASVYIAERQNEAAPAAVLKLLQALPKLLLMVLIFLLPALFSSMLFFIPLLIMIFTFIFAPLFAGTEKHGVIESLADSRKLSRGNRLAMGITFVVQYFIFSLPINLIMTLFPLGGATSLVLQAFANALFLLMRGRLIGIFYYFFRVQLVNKKLEDFTPIDAAKLFPEQEADKPDDQRKVP